MLDSAKSNANFVLFLYFTHSYWDFIACVHRTLQNNSIAWIFVRSSLNVMKWYSKICKRSFLLCPLMDWWPYAHRVTSSQFYMLNIERNIGKIKKKAAETEKHEMLIDELLGFNHWHWTIIIVIPYDLYSIIPVIYILEFYVNVFLFLFFCSAWKRTWNLK